MSKIQCGDCGDQLEQRGNFLVHADDGSHACTSRAMANRRRAQQGRPNIGHRELHRIADEIVSGWRRPFYGAVPYIRAMHYVARLDQNHGAETGKDIVQGFLANAGTWRGDKARAIKAELRGMIRR